MNRRDEELENEKLKEVTSKDDSVEKVERKMFKRLKLFVVYHSITTVNISLQKLSS